MIKRTLKSGYIRAIATLSTGHFFASLIPLLAAPVLGRLYLPVQYGPLITLMATVNILSVLSTFQMHHAIIAEKHALRAHQMVKLCQIGAVVVSLVGIIIASALFIYFETLPDYKEYKFWVFALPAIIIFSSFTTAFSFLATRQKRYTAIAQIQVVSIVLTVGSSIAFGFLGWGTHGLFLSYVLGQGSNVLLYITLSSRMRWNGPQKMSLKKGRVLWQRNRGYFLFSTPSAFVETINIQMPVFILSYLGMAGPLGAFSKARQLVGAPLTLLGNAIGQVFMQKGAKDYNEIGNCRRLYAKTAIALFLIGFFPMLLLMYFSEVIFTLVLGPNWEIAGKYAALLAPMFLFQTICSPISTIFYFAKKQHEDLFLSMVSSLFFGAGIFLLFLVKHSFTARDIIIVFSISYSLIYIIYIVRGWEISAGFKQINRKR